MEKLIGSKCKNILVAAICIGTTYSRSAFSLRDDWVRVMIHPWTVNHDAYEKAPTCLLLKKDQMESWFGYEAENKYAELTAENLHHDYYFFERFAMILHEDSSFCQRIVCKDIENKPLEAGVVFKHCILHLKKHLSKNIGDKINRPIASFNPDMDIQYVLTIPAFGGEKTKMFMREAALNTGIRKENLSIVLEPEAASIYCQYLKIAEKDSTSPTLGVLKPGTKYILADIGENPERLCSTYDQYREKNECYKMESNPRGVLLIINNSKFETYCGERLETEHDCKKLKDLFSVMGFKVLVKENLRASEMLNELQIFAKNQLLAQVDCMVLAVLSHGTTDVMCGTDGVGIDVMKSIVPIFSAIECPNLRGKPKMFICNACRGYATSQSIDIVPIKINFDRRIQLDDPDNSTLGTKHNIEYQDIVMCFSTFPGYESYTNLEEGSWFIQEFVSVFTEHSHHTHVLDMLTKINKKVSQKEYIKHATGSTCVQTSTLTDSWYLINTSVCCRFEPLSTEFSNVTEL